MTTDDDGIVDVTAAARFAGKVLLVTGAGSGLAAATARRYAADGGRVAVLDLDLASAESVAAESRAPWRSSATSRTRPPSVARCTRPTSGSGRLDHVVNAAGFAAFTPIEELSLHDWNRMLAVHLTGTFLVCRETLPLLREAGGGSIVNFASVAALVARPNAAAYAAAKGGIVSFSRQLALDAGADGVRVNVICPGSVQSPMSMAHYGDPQVGLVRPLPPSIQSRIAEADEIAAPVCFLLSDEASFVTGGLFVADGGATAV